MLEGLMDRALELARKRTRSPVEGLALTKVGGVCIVAIPASPGCKVTTGEGLTWEVALLNAIGRAELEEQTGDRSSRECDAAYARGVV